MNAHSSRQNVRLHITVRGGADTERCEIDGEPPHWIDQVRRFLSALEARGLSVNTVTAYAFDLVILSRWLADTCRTFAHIEESDLVEFIKTQRAAGIKPNSINRRLTTIEAFYRFVTGEHVPRGKAVPAPSPNPRGRGYDRLGLRYVGPCASRALRVKQSRTLMEPLTTDQVNRLLKTFDRYRDLAIVYLMLLCGLRSCEVLAIEIQDIDTERCALRVRGKGNKQRMLPLPPIMNTTMAAYLHLERPRHCLSPRLFVALKGRRRGSPMTRVGLRSLFRRRRLDPFLNNANPHRLRHTFGANMAREGLRLPALQKLMGHSDPNTTRGYINLSLQDVADAFHQACERIRKRYKT